MSKKDDGPTITVRIEKGRLVPVTAFDQELIGQWHDGAEINVNAVRVKVRSKEKQYFAMLSKLLKEADTPWSNTLTAHEALKLAAGFVEPYKKKNGTWGSHPRSIATFTDGELAEYFEIFCGIVEQRFGIDPATLQKEASQSSGAYEDSATDDGPGADPIPVGVGEPNSEGTSSGSEADDTLEPTPRDGLSANDPSFTAVESDWLKMTARMLVAATLPGGETDIVDLQVKTIKARFTPPAISQEAKDVAQTIYQHCRAVTKGGMELDKEWIAETAGCTLDDLRPEAR
jgi:hypothetical protein